MLFNWDYRLINLQLDRICIKLNFPWLVFIHGVKFGFRFEFIYQVFNSYSTSVWVIEWCPFILFCTRIKCLHKMIGSFHDISNISTAANWRIWVFFEFKSLQLIFANRLLIKLLFLCLQDGHSYTIQAKLMLLKYLFTARDLIEYVFIWFMSVYFLYLFTYLHPKISTAKVFLALCISDPWRIHNFQGFIFNFRK